MGVVGRGVSCLLRVWSWLCAGRFTCAVWREWAFCVRAQALGAFWLDANFVAKAKSFVVLMHLLALGAF